MVDNVVGACVPLVEEIVLVELSAAVDVVVEDAFHSPMTVSGAPRPHGRSSVPLFVTISAIWSCILASDLGELTIPRQPSKKTALTA